MINVYTISAKPRLYKNPTAVVLKKLVSSKEIIWADFTTPTKDEAKLLADVFKFHRLSIEDCFDEVHYPKIEQFTNYLFIILHTLEAGNKRRPTTEVDFFITNRQLVTVHQKSSRVLEVAQQHLLSGAIQGINSSDMMFQVLASRFIDEYFPMLDELDNSIDAMEDSVYKWSQGGQIGNTKLINQFLDSKKRITTLKRLLTPQRDIFSRLSRNEFNQVSTSSVIYFRDIYDRLFRITEMLDSFRDVLSSTLEAHLSVVSNRLNEIMKVLTIVTVIILPLTLVTGIYGMNFRYLPEIYFHWGYPWALSLMVVIAISMVWYFKNRRWL